MKRVEYLKRFKEIIDEMYALTTAKNSDYADSDDAFQNFKNVEALGLTSVEIGILTRMSDKFQRVCNLTKRQGKVTTESIQDTLKDLAVYSIILSIYLDDKIETALNFVDTKPVNENRRVSREMLSMNISEAGDIENSR